LKSINDAPVNNSTHSPLNIYFPLDVGTSIRVFAQVAVGFHSKNLKYSTSLNVIPLKLISAYTSFTLHVLVNVILKSFSSHSFTEVNPFTCNVTVSSIGGTFFSKLQVKLLVHPFLSSAETS
jgi:hypothetical protein